MSPALLCRAMDFIMEHVSHKVGIQVGQHTFTDIDYADDVALLVDKEESFRAALVSMDEEASKFGLRVSWTKTKIQNVGSGPTPSSIIVDGNTVDPVEEFTYLAVYSPVRATPDRNISGTLDSRPGIEKTRLCLESEQAQCHHEAPRILHVRVTHTTLCL